MVTEPSDLSFRKADRLRQVLQSLVLTRSVPSLPQTRTQRCVSTRCDSSSLWSWSRKSSPSRPPSSGAPCPCSASWPWPRAATRTCRPWPRSSWRTSAPWSVTRRGARCVPSPPPGPHFVFQNRHRAPCVRDGRTSVTGEGRECAGVHITSSCKRGCPWAAA